MNKHIDRARNEEAFLHNAMNMLFNVSHYFIIKKIK